MDTNQQNIHFNYYAIECLNMINSIDERDSLTQISASFRGRVNNPNIIYSNNNLTVNYQATNIYINDNIHSNISSQDGEIVILHRPTTTSLKLYACFPFKGSTKNSKTDIDKLIDTESYSLSNVYQKEPLSIEINKYIGQIPSVREYQTLDVDGQQCIVLVFENVIKINRCLDGNKLTKALFVASLEKPVVSTIEDKLKSPSILMEGFHEAMDDKKDISSIKDTKDIVNSDVVYKCEYLPVDTEDMVQVLQVPIGSPGYNKEVGNQVSGVFVSNSIFIFVVLVIFFISPLLYGFIESLVMSHLFLDNIVFIKTHLKTDVNLLNLILIMVFSVLTIILLIYGLIASDGTAIAISIFIPFCSLISYVGITFFKKSRINDLK
jgi:hypothetical protein